MVRGEGDVYVCPAQRGAILYPVSYPFPTTSAANSTLNLECDNSLSNSLCLTTSPCPTAAAKKGVQFMLLLLKTPGRWRRATSMGAEDVARAADAGAVAAADPPAGVGAPGRAAAAARGAGAASGDAPSRAKPRYHVSARRA